MIEISNVSKSYDGGSTFAVDDISLEIRAGEIFGLLGHNGAGKSTLLNMIVGVLALTKGSISIDGNNLSENFLETKRRMSFVGDSPDHLLRLKGHEFLRFIGDLYEVPTDIRAERIATLAKTYGMEQELDNQIQSYSHGMRQKIMVMGALLPNPDNWILDEPMTGLDPSAAWQLKQTMREHADAGKTVLFSTHVLDVAERVVDRVGIISHGKLLFVGTIEEMREHFKRNESLEEMFLELTSETSPLDTTQSQASEEVR
ncbi:ABC transporter ATP-binding protein [Collinsella sp. zg1085]|uniref:ABC transporter ATP-binding protein n=1 Tax=Collinsella sp. zg1085 TaxID=2844380 RepID=UPI001C0AD405|nr:ABC transporter ATP-binding protein [Collinsella sp. zg1085]QWT18205.1 ABC transporter ATP-binding protein [Collinsella sp. zg1085]